MNIIDRLFIKDINFYKRFFMIALPVTLQSLITIGISLIGSVMLGSLGEYQLSGSSLANNFISIFQILCMGMGFGTAVMTSQFWGSKDIPSIKASVTIMYRINIVIALCFTVASFTIPQLIMHLYTNDPMIVGYGAKYIRILSATYFLQGLSLTTSIILMSIGKVRIQLISSLVAFILNILFSWLFIFGNLGVPRLEIAGAAIGILLARIFECIFIFGYFIVIEKNVGYRLSDLFKSCKDNLSYYMKYSIPVIVSDFLLAIGMNIIAVIVGHLGAFFISANAIIIVVLQIFTVFTQGMSNASSIITGNTLGEGDIQKAYRQGVTLFTISAIVGILSAVLIHLLAPNIINLYHITEETRKITYELMSALSFTVIFQTIGTVMTKGVLRGGGDTKFLMLADILFLWIASVPLGLLAAFVLHLAPFWIFISLRIDHILKSIWCIKRLVSKKWIKVIKTNNVEESLNNLGNEIDMMEV